MLSTLVAAQQQDNEPRATGPERGIAVFTEFSGVTVGMGEPVRMELILLNKGRTDETINVKPTDVPKGWKVTLKGGSYDVSGLYVPARKTKNVTLSLEPAKGVRPGDYAFGFEAATVDGAFSARHTLKVNVLAKSAEGADVQLTTSYPVLRGPTDSKFEFSLEVLNKSEAERTLNIMATAPEKWEITTKPAYEEKQISSFRVKGGQSQNVTVQVTPAKDAPAGEYPILVRVSSGEKRAEAKLLVVLTGIYKLDAATPNNLLSIEAVPGQVSRFNFFVKNTGSAVNSRVVFDAFKPENWTVEFKPDKVDGLKPGDVKQIEVSVKPNAQALVGDYSVGLAISGEKADKTLEMRVTVRSSSAWGWIGIGIILFVIAGLCSLFVWLGRR
jgi:uncharacterized membrane protein